MSGSTPQVEDWFEVGSLRKRKVVDTATAETIGRVAGVHIDAAGSTLSSLVLKGRHAGRIPFGDVISVGPDAVTVGSAAVVVDDADPHPTGADAIGNRLLDDAGYELGTVRDLTVDQDGRVVSVAVDGAVYDARLLGIGSYAVVIERS